MPEADAPVAQARLERLVVQEVVDPRCGMAAVSDDVPHPPGTPWGEPGATGLIWQAPEEYGAKRLTRHEAGV
ncbi:hypothetical protein [Nonomuraea sp. CA-141351]|uniref:hypothetical protein n=1 Tax=Nonomuraea sp. CA-141351 TaxID=3239996 RepID=UPI003D8FD748